MDARLLERLKYLNKFIDCHELIARSSKICRREDFIEFLITSACLLDSDFMHKEDIIEYATETLLMQGPLSSYSDAIAEMHFREGEENTCFRGSKSPCGLANPDSICYMNATIQLLYQIKPLRKHFLTMDAMTAQKCEPAREIAKIFADMCLWLGFYTDPSSLCRSMAKILDSGPYSDMSRSYDASAFLRGSYRSVHERGRGVEEAWQSVTGSTTCVTVTQEADNGGLKTVRDETFQILPLPCEYREADDGNEVRISSSVEESMDAFFREHTLHPGGSVCKERLKHLSPYLILQLKRFWFDREEMIVRKQDSSIEVQETLGRWSVLLSRERWQ